MNTPKKNEQKSAEYVPNGPVRVPKLAARVVPPTPTLVVAAPKPVLDDLERMRAAHAARMAATDAPVSPSKPQLPEEVTEVVLPAPHVIFHTSGARSGRISSASENISNGPREGATADPIETIAEAAKLTPGNVRGLIVQECRATEALLLAKNSGYGNSALDPVRVFSKASPVAGILVRIDDKLSRISRGDLTAVSDENLAQTVDDLVGYLMLLKVAWRLKLR